MQSFVSLKRPETCIHDTGLTEHAASTQLNLAISQPWQLPDSTAHSVRVHQAKQSHLDAKVAQGSVLQGDAGVRLHQSSISDCQHTAPVKQ